MESIFTNHFILALYGFLIYTVLMFVMDKDGHDDAGKAFDYHSYLNKNWDNWTLSIILVPVMVYYASDIWGGIMDWQDKAWSFRPVYYLGVGALVEVLYWGIKKIKGKQNKN